MEVTVPAAAKLSQSISEVFLMGSSSPLRPLSKAMYYPLGRAIQVRSEFLERMKQTVAYDSVSSYQS